MRSRPLLMAALVLAACSRSRNSAPDAARSGAASVPPAILEGARRGVPDVPPPVDAGNGEHLATSAGGERAEVAGPHFTLAAHAAREGRRDEGRLSIEVRGAGDFRVDPGYPITIEVSASALELAKTSLRRVDAVEYSAERGRFEVTFRGAEQGETITCEVLFSVCREGNCEFESRRLVVVVP